jgi:hypothetical protein
MPSFSTEVPHGLGQEETTFRLKTFLERVRERYKDQVSNLKGEWINNQLAFSFTTYGFAIQGTLLVESDLVKLNGSLPLAAAVFRGKIEESIRSEIEKVVT